MKTTHGIFDAAIAGQFGLAAELAWHGVKTVVMRVWFAALVIVYGCVHVIHEAATSTWAMFRSLWRVARCGCRHIVTSCMVDTRTMLRNAWSMIRFGRWQ